MSSELVNPNGVFEIVRRIFSGTSREVAAELVQNAQRAGAKLLEVFFWGEDRNFEIEFRDSGHGIGYGEDDLLEGFRKLLSIGSSGFTDQVQMNQHPMGVGFYSLLTHEGVTKVRIESGGKKLALDVQRWFTETEYRSDWRHLIENGGWRIRGGGTSISFEAKEPVRKSFRNAFEPIYLPTSETVVSGYKGVMRVELNGIAQKVETPDALKPQSVFINTRYQGNKVRIGLPGYRGENRVNWYGQLVSFPFGMQLGVEFEVRKGSPLTPMSPSRKGFVEDEKARKFRAFLKSKVLKFFSEEKNLPLWTPTLLKSVFSKFQEAAGVCKYFIAAEMKSPKEEAEWINNGIGTMQMENRTPEREELVLLSRNGSEFVLSDCFRVKSNQRWVRQEKGIESFIEAIREVRGTVYRQVAGRAGNEQCLFWLPGQETRNIDGVVFTSPGKFGLTGVVDKLAEKADWFDLSGRSVWAAACTSSCSISYVDLVLGTELDVQGIVALLEVRAEDWFMWHEDCEKGESSALDEYWESVESIIRKLLGKTIRRDFTFRELLSASNAQAPISSIEFIRGDKKERRSSFFEPRGIVLRFEDGTSSEFSLR